LIIAYYNEHTDVKLFNQ